MAWMLNNQSKFKEASQVFEEVFNIQKVKLGYDHTDTLETRDNMMQMFSKQDKYERGEELQGRARKLQEEKEREEREREREREREEKREREWIRKEEARERKLEQSRRMDQWMLEKTRGMSQREIAEFKRSMATDCVIQSTHSNTRQQEAFLRGISNADVRQVKQGLYLPSFEARNVKINGKCTAITRSLSQALLLQSDKLFLSNLETSAEIYERIAQGKHRTDIKPVKPERNSYFLLF